jgi:hypothetical protein
MTREPEASATDPFPLGPFFGPIAGEGDDADVDEDEAHGEISSAPYLAHQMSGV